MLGRSTLIGNGLVPAYTFGEDGERVPDLYQNRREAIYTYPDETKNRLEQLAFNLQHALDAQSSISALAYVRHSRATPSMATWPTIAGWRRDEQCSTPPARARPATARA